MRHPETAGSDSDEDFHDATSDVASPVQVISKASRATTPEVPKIRDEAVTRPSSKGSGATGFVAVQAIEVANDDPPNDLAPPEHPLRTMQGPFEESILESSLDIARPTSARVNAEARRQKLLNSQRYDESWTTRWKQRPESKYHPLLKLVSQITFGMHLLQQNQAKSDQEVVKILQTHVDEVDNFLEKTTEDFEIAIRDVEERITFLQLPMQHMKVFDVMLDDKVFRTQLLDGNDKIEKIIDRTARSMNAALLDVQKGRQATRELGKYLNNIQYTWPSDKADLEAIYIAMRGNEEGWKKCYKDLQTKGNQLGNRLIELGTVVGEMSKMAAAASRRNAPQNRPRSSGNSSIASSTVLRSRYNIDPQSPYMSTPTKDKPLPRAPSSNGAATQPARPASFHQRFEKPRNEPTATLPRHAPIQAERPKTSSGPSTGTYRANAFDGSRRASVALSSHPPDNLRSRSVGPASKGSSKRSSTANGSATKPVSNGTATAPAQHSRARSAGPPRAATDSKESLAPSSNIFEKSSFARRWSIRKKHPGPTPDDYIEEPVRPARPIRISSPLAAKPMNQRLAPVREQSGKASLDQANAAATQSTPQLPLSPSVPPPPEPKSRTGSIKFGRSSFLQGMSPSRKGAESVHTGSESMSLASSIKRRTISLKTMFSRRSDKDI